jgi:triacylglycerol lipase
LDLQEDQQMSLVALRNPIVLVHGILGFDKFPVPFSNIEYFRGVAEALRQNGNTVPAELPQLNPAGSVKERANDLKSYLNSNPEVLDKRVHLFAHSMGGLDSRYMISALDMQDRVLTLTTIGTPHKGTPIDDVATSLSDVIDRLSVFGIDLRGFLDLTTEAHAQLDPIAKPSPNTFSIAGVYSPGPGEILGPSHNVLVKQGAGPNDGLVPSSSATFGTFLETWNANHFRLINWPTNILGPISELTDTSILDQYVGLAADLAGRSANW